jgi:hypothetical protein
MEYVGIGVLKSILMQKRCRVVLRYLFYDMKNQTMDFGISSPPELKYWNSCVGWCARGVDALADRMDFYGFRDDVFGLAEIYDAKNRDILFPSAIQGALIAGCSFIYISEDEYGYPRLQAINADDATGIVNPITGLLNEGYAVLERDMAGLPVKEAYFTHEYTAYYENGTLVDSREYAIKEPMLVPMVFRPDAKRVFGHSRITRSCMSQVCSALRTIKRSEISAEFYSFPQKYVTGVDQDAEQIDKWSAAMSAMMKFTLGEDGQDHVKLGQFTQQSMQPHIEQLKMFASLFASEVGLTLDDLGFPSANPSSYDAIRASHENLRLTARAAQKSFNVGILNAGYLAACIRDRYAYTRQQITVERPVWLPPFRADVSMLSGIGDALQKINGAYPEYLTEDKILELTGF